MKVNPVKTHKIQPYEDIFTILNTYLPTQLEEKTIVAVTSKIISLAEGAFVAKNDIDKHDLVIRESDYYIPANHSAYNIILTIKEGRLIPSAGIDESNAKDLFVCYPKNPYKSAEKIWEWLKQNRNINECGVIITDSTVLPLRRGVVGIGIAWCGFEALHDYRGTSDCFGNTMKITFINNIDAIASTAVFAMREGNEQTPIAIISGIETLKFQQRPPTPEEIEFIYIEPHNDLYAPILQLAPFISKNKNFLKQ